MQTYLSTFRSFLIKLRITMFFFAISISFLKLFIQYLFQFLVCTWIGCILLHILVYLYCIEYTTSTKHIHSNQFVQLPSFWLYKLECLHLFYLKMNVPFGSVTNFSRLSVAIYWIYSLFLETGKWYTRVHTILSIQHTQFDEILFVLSSSTSNSNWI